MGSLLWVLKILTTVILTSAAVAQLFRGFLSRDQELGRLRGVMQRHMWSTGPDVMRRVVEMLFAAVYFYAVYLMWK